MKKQLLYTVYLCFALLSIYSISNAQTFQQVTYITGSANIGINNSAVWVTSDATPQAAIFCTAMKFWIGRPLPATTTYADEYTFHFDTAVTHVRFKVQQLGQSEGAIFYINGQHYNLSMSNLSSLGSPPPSPCTSCVGNVFTVTSSTFYGDLYQQNNADGCTQIDIIHPKIDSVTISGLPNNKNTGGYEFSFYFLKDTAVYIDTPLATSTYCPGDTFALPYFTSWVFNGSNTFTAQLSNASGSFTSPTNIGSRSDTTGDTIQCVIPANMSPGNGYKIRIVSSSPVQTSVSENNPTITIKNKPQNVTVSSNTPICVGDTLKLNSTVTAGVSTGWSGPGSFSSSAEDTIRTDITAAMTGHYILTATLDSTGCTVKDTATVVVKPLPNAVTATSNSPACTGKTLNLSVGTSTNGSSYAWIGPGGYTANTQNTSRTNITTSMSGDYVSVITFNGCVYRDTTTVVINPTPATPTASNNGPLCVGQTLNLTSNTINNASYTWWGPASYTANTQNANRIGIQTNHAGTYMVTATVNGCESDTGKTTLVVNTAPSVTIYPSPSDTVCQGGTASFIAVPFSGGPSPVYNWRINGATAGSGTATFATTALNNGDIVDVVMTATGSCASAFVDTSNGISMKVLPYLTPTASITVSPGTLVAPWSMVSFSSTITNGGNNPQYQWAKNGQNIVGATSDNWGTFSLSDGDVICVEMSSDYKCPQPKIVTSNCIEMHLKLGTEDLNNIKREEWQLYPNPAHTVINLSINFDVDETKVLDAAGRDVLGYINADNRRVDVSNLPNGVYVLRITYKGGIVFKRFTKY